MNILITICARAGSKGIPDKNIKLLNNKPLLVHSIDLAKRLSNKLDGVVVEFSSDSDKYKEVARENGLYTDYTRPQELGSDGAGKIGVLKDVLLYSENKYNKKFDYLIDLEVTSPLRNSEDVIEAFEEIKKKTEALIIVGVSSVTKNPYYNMWEKSESNFWNISKKLPSNLLTRQSAPDVYASNGMLYIMRREFFDGNYNSIETERTEIYKSKHICFDIDEPIDFEFMNFLIEHNRLDFNMAI